MEDDLNFFQMEDDLNFAVGNLGVKTTWDKCEYYVDFYLNQISFS